MNYTAEQLALLDGLLAYHPAESTTVTAAVRSAK
jgi:hypothetical protein